jgi:hypothetical protein
MFLSHLFCATIAVQIQFYKYILSITIDHVKNKKWQARTTTLQDTERIQIKKNGCKFFSK